MNDAPEIFTYVLSRADTFAWHNEKGLPMADWQGRRIIMSEAADQAREVECSKYRIVDADQKPVFIGDVEEG